MEVKKSPEADLEQYRTTWLLAGLVVALSVLYVAFEWTGHTEEADWQALLSDVVFEEEYEVPQVEQPEVVPPPQPMAPAALPKVIMPVEEGVETDELPTVDSEGAADTLAPAVPAAAEEEKDRPATDKGLVMVDELPEFPEDGQAGLMRYLTKHIRYPAYARQRKLQGNVVCQFLVNEDGRISDVRVLQGVHPVLDNEAMRVLRSMPRWKPGRLHGKPVRVCYALPVVFRLQ